MSFTPSQGNQLELLETPLAQVEFRDSLPSDHSSDKHTDEAFTKYLGTTIASQLQRRHSPKGQATGWIEERIGNKKRKNPSTSYYYCWQEGERRMKVYVKARKMYRCHQMIEARCSVDDILQFLNL